MEGEQGAMTTPYDGTNCDLREPHCAKCGKEQGDGQQPSPSARLLRCSRCGVVMYCGVECQKEDYARHKKACRDVHQAKERLEHEAALLRSSDECLEAGSFWGLLETRNYMRQLLSLIPKLTDLARETQTKDDWSLVADYIQECLRLNVSDNNGLRYSFPLVLLRLNRDDDAYCFCKYWLTNSNFEDDNEIHSSSKDGDWIYPRQKDCRYLDVFKDCEKLEEQGDLWIFLAFAVIKMRLVAVVDAQKNDVAANAPPMDDETRLLSDQDKQLDRLLDLIDAHNKTMIPALLNPGPLMSQDPPSYYSPGAPTEARMMLPYVVDVWNSIPGASAYLAKRLGTTTPSYATS